jgi:IS5 family transposase
MNTMLLELERLVPWERFRAVLVEAWRLGPEERRSAAGRRPWDEVLMFKALVLAELFGLSDEGLEHQIADRLTFMRFLGLGLEDGVPDARTIWSYRERLTEGGRMEALFAQFGDYLHTAGFQARGGQLIDASLVAVPRQRNTREENAEIREQRTPEGWEERPAKLRQKDLDARWIKKGGVTHYGYKNHIGIDRKHKLVRTWAVTPASVHDSQMVPEVLDADNSSSAVWADSAYRSKRIEGELAQRGLRSRILLRGTRGHALNARERRTNRTRARVRARVEHVFGSQHNDLGGTLVRSIGIARAHVRIGLKNLAYNLRRFLWLRRASART